MACNTTAQGEQHPILVPASVACQVAFKVPVMVAGCFGAHLEPGQATV